MHCIVNVCANVQIETLPNLEIPEYIGHKVAAAQTHTESALAAARAGNYTAAVRAARASLQKSPQRITQLSASTATLSNTKWRCICRCLRRWRCRW